MAFTASPHAALVLRNDEEGCVIDRANRAAGAVLGCSPSSLRGQPWQGLLAPDHVGAVSQVVEDLLAGVRPSWEGEVCLREPAGRTVNLRLVPVASVTRSASLVCYLDDRTNTSEEAARLSEAELVADVLGLAVDAQRVSLDSSGRVTRISGAVGGLLGHGPKELYGQPLWDVVGAPDQLDRTRRLGVDRWVDRRGAIHRMLWRSAQHPDGGSELSVVDLTSQRVAAGLLQAALDSSENRAVLGVLPTGHITFANPAAERLTGCSVESLVGQTRLCELFDAAQVAARVGKGRLPPDADPVLAGIARLHTSEWRLAGGDLAGREASLLLVPRRDPHGMITGYVAIITAPEPCVDDDEPAAAHDPSSPPVVPAELVQTLDHEMRTPLASVLGNVELLLGGHLGELTDTQLKAARRIEMGAQRLFRLTEDLLVLTPGAEATTHAAPEPVDLGTLVHDCRARWEPRVVRRHIVWSVVDQGEVTVQGHAAQLGRVLDRVVATAVAFTPQGGRIELAVRSGQGRALISVTQSAAAAVEDGTAVDPEPDAADSDVREQFGLGLTVAHALLAAYGGRMRLERFGSEGTRVVITLPVESV